MSESQERMMAVVEPGRRRARSWRSAPSGTSRPSWSARSPTPAGSIIDWHGETRRRRRPPRTVAHDGPDLPAPLRPPRLAGRAAGRRRRGAAAAGDRRRAARDRCCGWSASPNLCDKSWITDQYDRYVQRQHRARAARRRRHGPRRRGDQPRRRGRHRLQRPLRQARPVRRRAARAGRGLPQRRAPAAPAAGRLRLPQLRLARGPGRDVAVRRGLPRPQGRAASSSASRSPAATSASTTRPATPRSCRPRWSPCSA